MQSTQLSRRQYRAFDNLPTKHLGYGRHMSGFVTPFRFWMWRQNELWRNVHEAQFEHLRRVYRRQWFESYRVNADEYIHKYNISKAATLAQWETEMHQQDAQRLDKMRQHKSLAKLKDKQRDLFKEAHERQFFQWYERASERLQAMRKLPYIPRSEVAAHIEAELTKYTAGQEGNYPLNFIGQIPLLEDDDGNIVEVPAHMMATHRAERPDSTATEYSAPKASNAEDHLLGLVSNDAHFLFDEGKSSLEQQVLEDIAKEEDELRTEMEKSSPVLEKSRDDIEAERRAYIERGKVGVKTGGWKKSGRTVAPARADSPASTGVGKKPARPAANKVDRKQIIEAAKEKTRSKLDSSLENKYASQRLSSTGTAGPGMGEVASAVPKIRSRLQLPSMEEVMANPVMASQMGGSSVASTQNAAKSKKLMPLPETVISAEGLQVLQDLLKETGADDTVLHVAQSKPMRRLPITSKLIHNDCLATDARETMVSPVSTIRTARSTSSMRGAVFCGKQNGDSMYLGRGFGLPPRESPGPIYQPVSTLDTTHGVSFTQSQRFSGSQARSLTPGPTMGLTSTIGSQQESQFGNLPNTVFSKSKRFPSERSREHNAPIAYQSNLSTNEGRGISIGGARSVATDKLFISRAHVADSVGLASPGPAYNIEDSIVLAAKEQGKAPPVFIAHKSNYSSGPAFSFAAKSSKGVDGSRRRAQSADPGPGSYAPTYTQVENVPVGVSFTKARKEPKFAPPSTDGPLYNPNVSVSDKHVSAVSFGAPPESGGKFASKQHIGKGFTNNMGAASPGPAYTLPPTDKGKSVTIAFKEKIIKNRLYPGPDRARFISKGLQSESLGAYSPGPKYNIQDDPMWKSAPSVSFGVSDRYFVDTNFTEEHRRKFGTAEKPYTSPAEARFVSLAHSKLSMVGKASPGPVGNPTIEACSHYRKPPSISIAPPPRKRAAEDHTAPAPQYSPSYSHIDMEQRVHAIPKAERFVTAKGTGVPGPGHYDVKFVQVEHPPKNVSVGIL